ncbi:gem-associated protein 2 [Notolabrus celidotus]|uniref:gem-associated protein 2 n=1 Tax=Notolabrus celidotus TaxID=1203425 RepID=UPI00148F79EA|nr:gem-associated protein 2 [Notolabrus celidotus]XP_034530551.1 gem-associated protein 2 [Notolabrus celidotus]XP_034530552.1 gem-associated protein 2 [Notolabrus celidotus]
MKSDVEELMPRLLPIEFEVSAEELDLNGAPRNPREYLRQVQLEASLCPEVVVAQIDPKKLKKKQTVNASVAGCHAAPAGFSPSLSWQQHQVGNFSDVRQSITKNRIHWSSHTLDDNVLMPKLTDEEGWKKFCLGETVYLGASSDCTEAESEPALDYSKVGFPPFLSIVSRLNQSTVLMVLESLISWFEEHEFTPQLGRWLYALLACLEKPLLPEAHSSIRQLARRCAQLRSALESEEDEKLPPLNLLICLVARYFEQNDLADQPE